MALTYRRGAIDALSSLVETRLAVLRSANGLDAAAELPEVAAQTRDYYQTALADGSHVTFLAFDGSRFVGAGGVSFFRVMPTVHIPTGQKAYIMNMYTHPDYRRRGIALHILSLLVETAQARGVTAISLEATDMGRPLYERFGFVPMQSEMMLPEEWFAQPAGQL